MASKVDRACRDADVALADISRIAASEDVTREMRRRLLWDVGLLRQAFDDLCRSLLEDVRRRNG